MSQVKKAPILLESLPQPRPIWFTQLSGLEPKPQPYGFRLKLRNRDPLAPRNTDNEFQTLPALSGGVPKKPPPGRAILSKEESIWLMN